MSGREALLRASDVSFSTANVAGPLLEAVVIVLLVALFAPVRSGFRQIEQRGARRRRARYHDRRCMNCGYDVRASPKRCPECGSDLFVQAMTYWKEVLDGR